MLTFNCHNKKRTSSGCNRGIFWDVAVKNCQIHWIFSWKRPFLPQPHGHAAMPPWKTAAVRVCVCLCACWSCGGLWHLHSFTCVSCSRSCIPAVLDPWTAPGAQPGPCSQSLSPSTASAACSTPFFCCLHSLQGQMEKTNSHTTLTSGAEKGGICIISSDNGEVINCLQKAMYLWLKQSQPH